MPRVTENIAEAAKIFDVDECNVFARYLPDINAYHYWTPIDPGQSMIMRAADDKLSAKGSATTDELIERFVRGERN